MQRIRTVVGVRPVTPARSAIHTPVDDHVFPAPHLKSHRLHHPPAGLGPIAGVYVNVAAPQADRAVVGISIAAYVRSTVVADEILGRPGKPTCHARPLPFHC